MKHDARYLVDGKATTNDWQTLARPIAVLPIGAFEQHGAHLPLATDALLATYFGEYLAAELGAALLPTLPIGQSYEHTGFRGSISLRPETMMAVVRDLVDELERQNFTRVILLNGHGGNFALPTVVRDINRSDRAIKVILIDPASCDRVDPPGAARDDVHAGMWETSLMAAIHPDLVGEATAPLPNTFETFAQSDLNHFGLGVLKPAGPWGDARGANAEYGRRAIESIKATLVAEVRKRLDWFDTQPSYGGTGPIALRLMTADDIPAGVRLCRLAGWNQQSADWALLAEATPDGCVAAVHNGKVVGTATAVSYAGNVGWIGMVLVDPAMRRRGMGTLLLEAAIDTLAGCESIKLDATPMGKQVYDRLGFHDEYRLSRMICDDLAPIAPTSAEGIRHMTEADLDAVIAMDAKVFGASRTTLLRGLFALAPQIARVAEIDGTLAGFILGRPGENFLQVGPIAADDIETAQALASTALADLTGKAVAIDATHHLPQWLTWLDHLGFIEQRPFVRMYKGDNPYPGTPANQFAIAGPEWG